MPSASWKETVEAASRQEALVTVLAGSDHDAVEGDRGGGRVLRYALGLTDAAQRLGPRLSQHSCMLRVRRCRVLTDGVGAGLRKERRRFGPCSDPSSADRARPPAASGNRQRGPGSRRPAPAMPRSRDAAAVTRSPVGHRTERGHDRLRRHRDPEPALPVPLDPGSAIVPVLMSAHSERMFVASRTRNYLLGRLGARLGTVLAMRAPGRPPGRQA